MENLVFVIKSNETIFSNKFVAIIEVYSCSVDLIGIVGFICLLVYNYKKKHRKRKRKGGVSVPNYHGPIFNQLLYISFFIIFVQLITRILTFSRLQEGLWPFILFVITSSFMFFYPTVISVILMFCFLAALQKMIILYQSAYKTWVTGNCLKWSIVMVWVANFHYIYLRFHEVFEVNRPVTCSSEDKTSVFIYQGAFLTCNFSSIYIYYKIYNVLSEFAPTDPQYRTHFLYQFVPIHIFLTIHTFMALVERIYNWMYSECDTFGFNLLFATLIFPTIPALVSMSYIASRHTIRMEVMAMFRRIRKILRKAAS